MNVVFCLRFLMSFCSFSIVSCSCALTSPHSVPRSPRLSLTVAADPRKHHPDNERALADPPSGIHETEPHKHPANPAYIRVNHPAWSTTNDSETHASRLNTSIKQYQAASTHSSPAASSKRWGIKAARARAILLTTSSVGWLLACAPSSTCIRQISWT